MRQPDECLCFGGSCWKYLCPNRPKKKRADNAPKERRKKGEVLTLRDSKKLYTRGDDEQEEG